MPPPYTKHKDNSLRTLSLHDQMPWLPIAPIHPSCFVFTCTLKSPSRIVSLQIKLDWGRTRHYHKNSLYLDCELSVLSTINALRGRFWFETFTWFKWRQLINTVLAIRTQLSLTYISRYIKACQFLSRKLIQLNPRNCSHDAPWRRILLKIDILRDGNPLNLV